MVAPGYNQLIERLARNSQSRLVKIGQVVPMKFGQVLCKGGSHIRHVYFPLEGFVSMITLLDGKPVLEVGMVGREGAIGAQLALGANKEPLQAVVQGAGSALRIQSSKFRRELARNPTLRVGLYAYLHATMTQLANSAACLRFHHISPRLARWLLMTQDRARSDEFFVTHEMLALMLGVRRVGITEAAAGLQRQGLLSYRRGHIFVLNRDGLIDAACACYANDVTRASSMR